MENPFQPVAGKKGLPRQNHSASVKTRGALLMSELSCYQTRSVKQTFSELLTTTVIGTFPGVAL